ncbi:MAG: hypothetical protein HQ582_20235 [Planctomycetes bacterium]|nr:hypothetical protein [Planctomycetota bacterium]
MSNDSHNWTPTPAQLEANAARYRKYQEKLARQLARRGALPYRTANLQPKSIPGQPLLFSEEAQ